jgi:hypothetical protein
MQAMLSCLLFVGKGLNSVAQLPWPVASFASLSAPRFRHTSTPCVGHVRGFHHCTKGAHTKPIAGTRLLAGVARPRRSPRVWPAHNNTAQCCVIILFCAKGLRANRRCCMVLEHSSSLGQVCPVAFAAHLLVITATAICELCCRGAEVGRGAGTCEKAACLV